MLSLEGKTAGEIRRIFQEFAAEISGEKLPVQQDEQPVEVIIEHLRPMLGDMVKTPWVASPQPILEIQDGAYYVQQVGFLHEPMFSKYYRWNVSSNQWEMRK